MKAQIKETLLFFDVPQIAILSRTFRNVIKQYFALLVQTNEDHEGDFYFSVCVSDDTLNAFHSGLIDARTLLAKPERRDWYKFTSEDGKNFYGDKLHIWRAPVEFLPADGLYIIKKEFENKLFTKESQPYRINLNKKWKMDDLNVFSKRYIQIYYLTFLMLNDQYSKTNKNIKAVFDKAKLSSGLGSSDFYQKLSNLVPPHLRLGIASIQFNSPGHIDLKCDKEVAIYIGKMIEKVTTNFSGIEDAYHIAYTEFMKKDISKNKASKAIENLLDLLELQEFKNINSLTGDWEQMARILLSFMRRIFEISQLQYDEKIKF